MAGRPSPWPRRRGRGNLVGSQLISVSAHGLGAFSEYVDLIRDKVPELEANGVEYEEHDRRDPVTATLLIAIGSGALSAAASAAVQTIIERLCAKAKKQLADTRPLIEVRIHHTFVLPDDQARVLAELAKGTE